MSNNVVNPFEFFTDTGGDPLDAGFIYIGQIDKNPEEYQVAVYWDSALSIPAAQPIRTVSGYPSRNGSPAHIFTADGGYSITVKNSRGKLVYTALDSNDFSFDSKITDDSSGEVGAGIIPFSPANVYNDKSVGIILQRETRSEDYNFGESSFDDAFARAKANSQAHQEVGITRGMSYNFVNGISIEVPLAIRGDGQMTTLYNGSTTSNLYKGVAVFTFSGVVGDAVTIAPEASGARLAGVVIDCSGQVSGNGLVMLGGAPWRSNRSISHVAVRSSSGNGIVLENVKEDFYDNVLSLDNALNGWNVTGSDLWFRQCWAGRNGASGLVWNATSGAGRFDRFDSFDNAIDGIRLHGQNASFTNLQVDLNGRNGVRIEQDGVSPAPKRFQFNGGNSLGSEIGFSDFYVANNASNITIVGWHFGYGHSGDKALYGVEDAGSGVCNSIIGCTFERAAYSNDVVNERVKKSWSVYGCDIDSRPMGISNGKASNLVVNGQMDYFRSGIPQGWIMVGANGTPSQVLDPTTSFSALQFVTTAADANQGVQQTIDIPAGYLSRQQLIFSADVTATGDTVQFMQIREGASVQNETITSDGITRRISMFRNINTTNDITICFETKRAGDGAVTGTLIVDNVSVSLGGSQDVIVNNQNDQNTGFSTLPDAATPSVRGYNNWYLSGATPVTNFTNGFEGKTMVIIGSGTTQIVNGSNIVTRSGASVTLAAGSAMNLRFIDGKWREI